MKRFIITVLVLTVLHAVACIIAPPFEFGRNRTECHGGWEIGLLEIKETQYDNTSDGRLR